MSLPPHDNTNTFPLGVPLRLPGTITEKKRESEWQQRDGNKTEYEITNIFIAQEKIIIFQIFILFQNIPSFEDTSKRTRQLVSQLFTHRTHS